MRDATVTFNTGFTLIDALDVCFYTPQELRPGY